MRTVKNEIIDPTQPLNFDGCFGCNEPQAGEDKAWGKYRADLSAIWAEITELRFGQPTLLRALP